MKLREQKEKKSRMILTKIKVKYKRLNANLEIKKQFKVNQVKKYARDQLRCWRGEWYQVFKKFIKKQNNNLTKIVINQDTSNQLLSKILAAKFYQNKTLTGKQALPLLAMQDINLEQRVFQSQQSIDTQDKLESSSSLLLKNDIYQSSISLKNSSIRMDPQNFTIESSKSLFLQHLNTKKLKGICRNTKDDTKRNDQRLKIKFDFEKNITFLNRKRFCGIVSAIPGVLIDEPVLLLWSDCVIDLRQSIDLSFSKQAGWNKFLKLGKIEENETGVRLIMSNLIYPVSNTESVYQILLKYQRQDFYLLAERIREYQKIIDHSISFMRQTKLQFQGREEELQKLQEDKFQQFIKLKELKHDQQEKKGSIYISLTTFADIHQEQILIRDIHIGKQFLHLFGITPEQFATISMRRGGIEFCEPLESIQQVQCVLDLMMMGLKSKSYTCTLKTFDNIDLTVNVKMKIHQIDNNSQFFFGGNYLLIQKYTLSKNQLDQLMAIRTNQIKNPLIEWEEDFTYTIQSEYLLKKFYSEHVHIPKKYKRLQQIKNLQRKNVS